MASESRYKRNLPGELKSDWPSIAFIIAMMVTGVLVYPRLPDLVPSHWNIRGEVDAYSSRTWGAFGIPLITAGIYLLMTVIPSIDPKKENYARFRGAYRYIKLGFTVFFAWLYAVVLANSLGWPVPVDRAVVTAMGLLFMVIGNFLGQIRYNYFVGIRAPWTLASEEVWQKTHRFASGIWFAAGLAIALAGISLEGQRGFVIVAAALGAAVFIPIVYSYLIHSKIKKQG